MMPKTSAECNCGQWQIGICQFCQRLSYVGFCTECRPLGLPWGRPEGLPHTQELGEGTGPRHADGMIAALEGTCRRPSRREPGRSCYFARPVKPSASVGIAMIAFRALGVPHVP